LAKIGRIVERNLRGARHGCSGCRSRGRDAAPVRGPTHGFYKYPARFSPAFAYAAIKVFSEPGDLVLDPMSAAAPTIMGAKAIDY